MVTTFLIAAGPILLYHLFHFGFYFLNGRGVNLDFFFQNRPGNFDGFFFLSGIMVQFGQNFTQSLELVLRNVLCILSPDGVSCKLFG